MLYKNLIINKINKYQLISTACFTLIVLIGFLSLLDWTAHLRIFTDNINIPMAPCTALSFIILGIVLLINNFESLGFKGKLTASIFVFLVFTFIIFLEFNYVINKQIENIFIQTRSDYSTVHMSLITVDCILICCIISFILIIKPTKNTFMNIVGILSSVILLISLIILLGHMYGVPLIYYRSINTVSLNTALSLLFISIGMITCNGPNSLPLYYFLETTVKARLMRAFLPIPIISVIVHGVYYNIAPNYLLKNPTILAATSAIIFSLITCIVISQVARVIGNEMDQTNKKRLQAEGELTIHRNYLEFMVMERTNEINKINIQLQKEIYNRTNAEEVLSKQLTFLQRLIDTIPNPIVYKDKNGIYQGCNTAFEEFKGLTKEKIVGKTVHNIYPKELAEKYHRMDLELLKTHGKQIYETSFLHTDGTKHEVILNKAVYLNNDNTISGIVGVIIDITERKQMEDSLATERQRLFSLLDCLPALVYLQAPDYSISFSNQYFWKLFGKPKNRYCYDILNGLSIPCQECPTFQVFKTKEPQSWEWTSLDGYSYQLYTYPFTDIDGLPLVLVLGIDITERKQLEKEIARLDRLNLIGEMAAGIAHEIRNPMTTVRGFLQMLGSKKECAVYKNYYDIMIEELDRANSIITEFLSLAKNKVVDLKVKNINAIVETIYPLIQADAMVTDNYVILKLGEVSDLLLDEKEIRQLILNLARNGLQSMSTGKKMTIKTYMDKGDVVLEVQDEGKGIEAELIEKIGTPFFTTKEYGTGLGLAICYSIADRHNAAIKTKTGKSGTTFFVSFTVKGIS